MEEKKYILTDETITICDHTLHRIKALKDFGDVKAGDLGGFVEKEENLSHKGMCWVYIDAIVFGEARVCGEACVYDEACVCSEACVYGEAVICGQARIYDKARVCSEACVCGEAHVYNEARVHGKACVCGEAFVCGEAHVYGEACVCGEAFVCGEAHVYGEAFVYGDARICEKASIVNQYDILCIPNIGSRKDTTTFFNTKSGEIYVACGCFTGTIEEFEKAVEKTHRDDKHGKAYNLAIAMAKQYIHIV